MEKIRIKQISKLSWIINNACNLNCIHCYPNSGIENKKDFSDDDFIKMLKNFKGMHFHRTFLSGGEPLLDKNFYKYLQVAKQISDEVFICSNGTLLTESKLNELVSNGVDGIVLSCQAIDADTAFRIYGNSQVPNLVFDAIKRIQKLNIALSVEISLMQQNVKYLDNIIELLISYGVKSISFKRLLPVGRGDSIKVGLSKKENYEVLKKIYNWQVTHNNVRFNVHDPLYGTILFDHFGELCNDGAMLRWLHGFSCRAGTRWIGIDPLGNVSPCPILLYKDTIIGNMMNTPLIEILNNSALMKLFQKIDSKKSNSCKYGSVCLGCRATAIAKNGDLFSKDPMCVHKNNMCPSSMKREDE
ncbi:MAG: radical SAM protein [Erysipelotrichales bacterium]|nr:radical SAM protein [Erysipelotrichales bacterium]